MRHWGHDITDEDTPLESGLGFTIAWDKPVEFNGRRALEAQRELPRTKRLIQVRIEDPDLLTYHDEPLYRDSVVVGRISSSMWSATQNRCCAMGYVEHQEAITNNWARQRFVGNQYRWTTSTRQHLHPQLVRLQEPTPKAVMEFKSVNQGDKE